jgi:hypothetical protein
MRLVLLALALIALPIHAQTFKCTVAGKVTYQDAPCANGVERGVDTSDTMAGTVTPRAPRSMATASSGAQAPKVEPKGRDPKRVTCTKKYTPAGRPSYGGRTSY